MNFFDHKDLGNHRLQLGSKVVKHPVYPCYYIDCAIPAQYLYAYAKHNAGQMCIETCCSKCFHEQCNFILITWQKHNYGCVLCVFLHVCVFPNSTIWGTCTKLH